jgi:hypothetical protein
MTHGSSVADDSEPDMTTPLMMTDGTVHDDGHVHSAQSSSSDEGCEESGNTHERSSCGTCAGCSIGAYAPPPVIAVTAIEEPANRLQQFSSSPFSGHIPARIERPPRTSTPIAA